LSGTHSKYAATLETHNSLKQSFEDTVKELTAAKLEVSEYKLKMQETNLMSEELKHSLEQRFEKQEKEIAHK